MHVALRFRPVSRAAGYHLRQRLPLQSHLLPAAPLSSAAAAAQAQVSPQVDDVQEIRRTNAVSAGSSTAPHMTSLHASVDQQQYEQLKAFIDRSQRIVVLGGAGLSTESGISDYRSPGRPPHKPMQHSQFMQQDTQRKRYWARSMVGYQTVWKSQPNNGHKAIAYAEQQGKVSTVITQNVDGLHQLAGSQHVIELHGSIHRVRCQTCDHTISREKMQGWLAKLNPQFYKRIVAATNPQTDISGTKDVDLAEKALSPVFEADASKLRPDGDADIDALNVYDAFKYPSCPNCNTGILKADVVFFGANVPKHVHQQCDEAVAQADALLVVGSSLAVWSAYRLVRAAIARSPHKHKLPVLSVQEKERAQTCGECDVAILNDGPTRADTLVDVKLAARAGQVLPWLFDATHLLDEAHIDLDNKAGEAPL